MRRFDEERACVCVCACVNGVESVALRVAGVGGDNTMESALPFILSVWGKGANAYSHCNSLALLSSTAAAAASEPQVCEGLRYARLPLTHSAAAEKWCEGREGWKRVKRVHGAAMSGRGSQSRKEVGKAQGWIRST